MIWNTLSRLFNLPGLSNPDKGYQLGAWEKTSTEAGRTVTDEAALKISAVWACVQLIANSVAGMKLEVTRADKDGNQQALKSRHYLTDLLHIRPNRYMKPRDFRLAMTVQMALWNNAYAEIVRQGDRVVALMPLRPGRMTPFMTNDGSLVYHYQVESGVKVYAQESILHLKGITADGVVGLERNNYSREALGLAASADVFAARQFANGGRPGGVLMLDKILTSPQREQLRGVYQGMSEGAINANKLWVLEGGMQYQALDFTADQMQMISTRMHQLGEVARYFGVPDVLIGAGTNGSSAWPASFEQQVLSFLTFTLQAYTEEWEAAIKYALLPPNTDLCIDHDTSALQKMDSTSLSNFLSRNVQNGLMTRNEARKLLKLPRVENGDELTVQTNLSPLDDLEQANAAQTDQSDRELPTQVRQ